jgi:hypothetical protein
MPKRIRELTDDQRAAGYFQCPVCNHVCLGHCDEHGTEPEALQKASNASRAAKALREPSFPTFGELITSGARCNGLSNLLDMAPGMDFQPACTLVDQVARLLEEDCPAEAMALARVRLDLTGSYRLLAALAAGR